MQSQHKFKGIKFPQSFSVVVYMCVFLQLPTEMFSANQPSLEIIPAPNEDLIHVRYRNFSIWTDRIAENLKVYYAPGKTEYAQNLYQCSVDRPPKGFVCEVDVKEFQECRPEVQYGYDRLSPCIFLKIHTIPGWIPEFYTNTSELPKDMPDTLRSQIIGAIESQNIAKIKTLWVSCEGELPADKEFIGPVDYFPLPGYRSHYFPMEDSKYLSPLVAVKFHRPQNGVVINIECRLWAKNIQYNQTEQLGYKSFLFLLDF